MDALPRLTMARSASCGEPLASPVHSGTIWRQADRGSYIEAVRCADGTQPTPGGWNRISLEVTDLDGRVTSLRAAGVHFRNEIVTGVGGRQILVDDPSGNPVELFEPYAQ
jgi:catechol 2,3-dioxygenase-like lactoylglutathione lyase family enzyme